MGRNLPSFSRFLASIVIIALVMIVNVPHVANVVDRDQELAEILGRIEVRGQQPNLSDGRTASYAAAASYLLSPLQATERGAGALAAIDYPWQGRLQGWTIEFHPGEAGPRGLTFTSQQRIEVYVREGDSRFDLTRTLAHEIGHAVDLVYNDAAGDRERWLEQRDADLSTRWWPDSGAIDFATGAGDFAECFATWQTGSLSLSRIAGRCSADDLELVAELSG